MKKGKAMRRIRIFAKQHGPVKILHSKTQKVYFAYNKNDPGIHKGLSYK